MNYEKLQTRLREVMQGEIDRKEAVGTQLRVYHRNREVFRGCFGIDNTETGREVREDDIYRLFSMTKPITSAAVYTLLEQGRLSLEDAVEQYLPGFREMQVHTPDGLVPARRKMTVADLLHMVSGLEYPHPYNPVAAMLCGFYQEQEQKSPDQMLGTVEFCNRLGDYPLLYQPGERWNYGTSADVLGAIVEVVSGKSFRTYLKETVLTPLGMNDTDFFVPQEKRDRLASMYIRDEQGNFRREEPTFLALKERHIPPAFESGGAGLLSTLEDYSRFALMLLNRGTLPAECSKSGRAVTILRPETVAEMTVPGLTEEQRRQCGWESMKGFSYGSLMRILVAPDEVSYRPASVGEFGWDGWTGNYLCIDPTKEMTFLYMVQQANGCRPQMYDRIKQAVCDGLAEAEQP